MNTLRCDILRFVADQHPIDPIDPNNPDISDNFSANNRHPVERIASCKGFTTGDKVDLLNFSIRNRLIPMVDQIIKSGINLNQRGKEYQVFPIEGITQDDCDLQILELLLKNGANPNVKLHDGRTPLSLLVGGGEVCIIAMYLWGNLSGNGSYKVATPVEDAFAQIRNQIENIILSIDLLIKYGANPTIPDNNGKIAEDYAYSLASRRAINYYLLFIDFPGKIDK